MDFLTMIERIFAIFSPIFIAWCGWKISVTDRQNKAYRELRQQYDESMEKQRKKEQQEQANAIASTAKKVDELTAEVTEIRRIQENQNIAEDIHELTKLVNINFEYCQSLSDVVSTMGQTSNNKDVQEAVAQHKKTEHDLVSRIYKIQY